MIINTLCCFHFLAFSFLPFLFFCFLFNFPFNSYNNLYLLPKLDHFFTYIIFKVFAKIHLKLFSSIKFIFLLFSPPPSRENKNYVFAGLQSTPPPLCSVTQVAGHRTQGTEKAQRQKQKQKTRTVKDF